jgi:phosphoribosylformimino-5-aminoimidazole carboxamide ribotide isomerase
MKIFPAIDLFDGKAVRLYKGDYNQMTVYSDNPLEIAMDFKRQGAECIHIVDLEGAKTGKTPNIEKIKQIKKQASLFTEVGGGIRSMEVIDSYLSAGIDRVILGTIAVENPQFLEQAVQKYGDKIAVGVDVLDGLVAIKGWTEKSRYDLITFCKNLQKVGVKVIICTDISKDGAMQGANQEMYKTLKEKTGLNVIASGGVSSLNDISALRDMGMYGAIVGKAYYIKAMTIEDAIKVANDN